MSHATFAVLFVLLLCTGCATTDPTSDRQRDCGLRISDCGLNAEQASPGSTLAPNPQSEIRNPQSPPITATFSILAVDPETGVIGAAVASKYPGVGRVVPYLRAGVGGFITQHWHKPAWGERALDLLAGGSSPEEVLGVLLKDDKDAGKRQLAILSAKGRGAQRHCDDADPSGVWWGGASGRYYLCQGNTLAGREVVEAMARAFETTKGPLADRLMAALLAGDQAGGDHRGRLAAGIRLAKPGVEGLWFDLQVDRSDDAVNELVRTYLQTRHEAKGAWPGPTTRPGS